MTIAYEGMLLRVERMAESSRSRLLSQLCVRLRFARIKEPESRETRASYWIIVPPAGLEPATY